MPIYLAGFVDCWYGGGGQPEPRSGRTTTTGRLAFVPITLILIVLFQPFGVSSSRPAHASFPIIFESNVGQVPSPYRFVSRHGTVEALFSRSGVDLLLPKNHNGRDQIGFRLIGAKPGIGPETRDVLPSVSHYFLGSDPSRWIHNVPNHSQVIYPDIYPGVDLIFHGSGDDLEHDFRISPRADPARLRLSIAGAERISLAASGDLEVYLGSDTFVLQKPHAYQESARGRKSVESSFVLNSDDTVQFRLGPYDRNRELVIDPVFSFSTYLASVNGDVPLSVTSDSGGNIYVTGYTNSLDFPIVDGLQPTSNGLPDAFVSKLDPTGHTLLYSTYLGGPNGPDSSSVNYGNAIAVDSLGNIIVAGYSNSNNFPHVGSVPTFTCEGGNNCFFLASLTPDGGALNYSGLVGGTLAFASAGLGILAVDTAGNAYLAGVAIGPNAEITPGTLSSTVPGYPYNFTLVLKVGPTGELIYSTIVPGTAPPSVTVNLNDVFAPAGISVDTNGQVTIAGTAGPGLPSTAGVIQPTFPNNLSVENASAGFVFQLNATASAINYATYVSGTDTIGGLAVDSLGNSYVTGSTSEANLPVSGSAYQKTLKPGQNCTCNGGFILKLNGTGTTVPAATYLGGTPTPTYNEGTAFTGIALDSNSNVFVGGGTESTDFPIVDPFVSLWVYGSGNDMVLAEMSPDLSSLLFGSFLSSTDQVFPASQFSAVAVDYQDNLIVVGETSTTDFPTTPGSFQPVPPTETGNGFVAKINMAIPAPSVCLNSWNVKLGSVPATTSSTQIVQLTNCGNAALSIASVLSSAATVTAKQTCGTIASGSGCPISLTYTPLDSSAVAGTITLTDNAAVSRQVLNFSGQGEAPPSFSTSATSLSPASVMPGGSATSTITIASLNGSNANITLSCSSITLNGSAATTAPPTCSFSATSVSNSSGTSTLTVSTIGSSAMLSPGSMRRLGLFNGMWLTVAGLALIGAGLASAPRRKRFLGVLLICLSLSGLVLLAACGGGSSGGAGSSGGTPAGTYTITVRGAAGSTVNTTTLTLKVQ
jgi:hypothetical protein